MKRNVVFAAATLALFAGCNESALQQAPDAGPAIAGLSAEQSARVVAKVGDRTITLGEFAKALERMDQFDRLRYQSKERRRELLDEMIDVELLASEARRVGLDKDPEAEDAIRMILRDAMLAKSRDGMPTPAQIPEQDVRAYYESHLDKFTEPERRRVAAIVMTDRSEATKVLKDALKAKSQAEWGELFFKSSTTAPKTRGPNTPAELAGDLGIVGPPDDAKGANAKVPEAVRAVAFKLKAVGDMAEDLIEAEGQLYIVRLNGITAPHKRTLAEAERSIRVLLLQEMMAQREKALEDDLKKKFPVEIDERALAAVKLPGNLEKWESSGASQLSPSSDGADAGKPGEAPGGAAPRDRDGGK